MYFLDANHVCHYFLINFNEYLPQEKKPTKTHIGHKSQSLKENKTIRNNPKLRLATHKVCDFFIESKL